MVTKWNLIETAISESDKLAMIKFISETDMYSNGKKVKEFEAAWSKWQGRLYSVFVNSGSAANLLLFDAICEKYNIRAGSDVLTQGCTWITTISPILQRGCNVKLCDINLRNYGFNIESIKRNLGESERNRIRVIFATHLLGFPAPLVELNKLFPNAIIIEDCCESYGATSVENKVQKVGNFGVASTMSFFIGHQMTTIEGGMICTDDYDLYQILKMKRSHGFARESDTLMTYANANKDVDPRFLFMHLGYNCRSTEINAVLGLEQLKRLDDKLNIRRQNYIQFINLIYAVFYDYNAKYNKVLDVFYPFPNQIGNANFALPFLCKTPEIRDLLKDILETYGIENRVMCGGNLLRQPAIKRVIVCNGDPAILPNCELISDNFIYIGNHHSITNDHWKLLKSVLTELKAELELKEEE